MHFLLLALLLTSGAPSAIQTFDFPRMAAEDDDGPSFKASCREEQKQLSRSELRAAAKGGNAPAQFCLAELYETGKKGLPADTTAAVRWTTEQITEAERLAVEWRSTTGPGE
jgi:TPR repeat protein